MPMISYGVIGVPGCLEPLNYKSRLTAILENQRDVPQVRRYGLDWMQAESLYANYVFVRPVGH